MAETEVLTTYAVDGVVPHCALMPSSPRELHEHLRQCDSDGLAVIPVSGRTRTHVGNSPDGYDVALDLSSLPAEIEHEPGDMTAICDANVKVADLESLLRATNQRLPFRVPNSRYATVGGSVASNVGGRLRPRFGGIRDWVIGMHVVSTNGVSTKSGGRVVKNVQGFELHRLHTGAFGSLGIITNVAFKLVPLPKSSATVAMWFDDHQSAVQATDIIAASGLEIDSCRLYLGNRAESVIRDIYQDDPTQPHLDDESPAFLLLTNVAGSPSSVRYQVEYLRGLSGTFPTLGFTRLDSPVEEVWDYLDDEDGDATLVAQFAGLPSDVGGLLHRLQRILARDGRSDAAEFCLDGGYGSLRMAADAPDGAHLVSILEAVGEAARANGCTYLVERCPADIKENFDVFGIDPNLAHIMRRTKRQFDPNLTLNRGRFAFRI